MNLTTHLHLVLRVSGIMSVLPHILDGLHGDKLIIINFTS